MAGVFDAVIRAQQALQSQRLGNLQAARIRAQQEQLDALAPLEMQLKQMAVQRGQAQQQQQQRQLSQEDALIAGRLADQALQTEDPDLRQAIIAGGVQRFNLNIDPAQVTNDQLQAISAQAKALTSQPEPAGAQKGKTVIVDQGGGKLAFATSVFNPATSQTEVSVAPISGTLVSELGESREQQIDSRTEEAKRKALESQLSKEAAESLSEKISNGLVAADSTAILRRTETLLNEIDTGGFQGVLLKAKAFVGAEGADEAELSFNLAKNVLQQLKPTFGAAFTKAEKESLDSIEARISKSAEGNKRLIQSALKIAERAARRGIEAAKQAGKQFDFEREEIESALKFSLEPIAADDVAGPQPQKADLSPQAKTARERFNRLSKDEQEKVLSRLSPQQRANLGL